MHSTRGLRNRNPGNIRHSGVRYLGECPGTDTAFKSFTSAAWGYRAMFVLLYTYRVRYGLQTLAEMIGRYAPESENDTQGYIRIVAQRCGVAPQSVPDLTDGERMQAIVSAMSYVENGIPAIAAEVEEGWRLFLQHKP